VEAAVPKINVYLPDDLARAVREAGIPISSVCQRALADAVAAADGSIGGAEDRADAEQPTGGWQPNRFTDRARRVFDLAIDAAGSQESVTSVHLIQALVEQGNNLALSVLRSLDIEPEDLLNELRATASASRRAGGTTAATLKEVGERAARAAIELDNNFIGCEHVLLGILRGPEQDPARSTLATLGLDFTAVQHAVRAALSGYNFAQSNLSLSGLSAPVRSILEEIRQRLGRLEQPGGWSRE
jgi:ATP-dependent Clp protease ATP-binding subunit ClpC